MLKILLLRLEVNYSNYVNSFTNNTIDFTYKLQNYPVTTRLNPLTQYNPVTQFKVVITQTITVCSLNYCSSSWRKR